MSALPSLTESTRPRRCLLGDIGGTNARFGWQEHVDEAPTHVATYACAEHESLLLAMERYLADQALPRPASCALGIANPIVGDLVRMTNHHWSFSIAALQQQLGVERLAVINDFTALAWALPTLQPGELHPIAGPGLPVAGKPVAVLGPGTGLGVSGLLPTAGGQYVAVSGEGGHVTLAAHNEFEATVLEHLRRTYGHASAERAVSGPGLVELHRAVCTLAGAAVRPMLPADVIDGARGGDDLCASTLDVFCSFLASVAGNLALTLGATGGVYIGGGIAPRLLPELQRPAFGERFAAKGRFEHYLRAIPVVVIDAAVSPSLRGAARALGVGA